MAHINTSAGQFAQFDELLNNSFLIDSIQLSNLDFYRDQLSNAIIKLDSLDSTIPGIVGAEQLSSSFFYYRSTLLAPIEQMLIQLESIELQVNTSLLTALTQCSQALLTLPRNNVYEWNQAFLYGLVIKDGQGIGLSENDILTLRVIANECPEVAGSTRRQATNMLPAGDPAIYLPDVPDAPGCQNENRESIGRMNSLIGGVYIYPNPVYNDLNIVFDVPFSGILEVIDLNGTIRNTFSLNLTNNFNASLDNLPSGLYILVLKTGSGIQSTLKFAVSR